MYRENKEALFCPSCGVKTEHVYVMLWNMRGYWRCLNCNFHQSQTEKYEEEKRDGRRHGKYGEEIQAVLVKKKEEDD